MKALAGAALVTLAAAGTLAQESNFGPKDAKEVYYRVSNKASLPLFVTYDYVGMKKVAEELKVQVRVAGPTDFDMPGYIAAVELVCAQKPAGVSVVGGWDPSLTAAVDKCISPGVPTVSTQNRNVPCLRKIEMSPLAWLDDWAGVGDGRATRACIWRRS